MTLNICISQLKLRFGAHNWEGPGALTAMSALQALSTMTLTSECFPVGANPNKVLFAGTLHTDYTTICTSISVRNMFWNSHSHIL